MSFRRAEVSCPSIRSNAFSALGYRQSDGLDKAFWRCAVCNRNGPAKSLDDLLCDRKTEARARHGLAAGGVNPEEGLEHVRDQIFSCHALATMIAASQTSFANGLHEWRQMSAMPPSMVRSTDRRRFPFRTSALQTGSPGHNPRPLLSVGRIETGSRYLRQPPTCSGCAPGTRSNPQ